MTTAFSRAAAFVAICSRADSRLAAYRAGRAERAEGAEGKIKEDGTMSGRFWKLSLSAHWLGEPRAAPYFLPPRAACLRKALALQDFERHHGRRTPDFGRFGLEALV
jgi:hypothetical protein